MKKNLSVFLILYLCLCLIAGCQKKEDFSSDFDSGENQKENLSDCYYEVPKTWNKKSTSEEDSFYYPENGILMVHYEDCTDSIWDEGVKELYIRNFTDGLDGLQLNESETITFNNIKGYKQIWNFNADGKTYNSETVIFDCENGIMNFTMNTVQSSKCNYSKDFQSILDTIQIKISEDNNEYSSNTEKSETQTTGNILLDTDVDIEPSLNGSGEVIGTWGKYTISKEEMSNVTPEQFKEFMDQKVLDTMKGVIDYATIVFDDGTGIHFIPGVNIADYGIIGEDGSITQAYGNIVLREDNYVYESTQ